MSSSDDLITYITPKRFDLMAKYIYIKFKCMNINSTIHIDIYKRHIQTFNNCWEYPGTKVQIEDFINSFDELIVNVKQFGFNYEKYIPIDKKCVISNGAHRLMVCFYFNILPVFKVEMKTSDIYNSNFFLNRIQFKSMNRCDTDFMALEYVKIQPNLRCMVVFPNINYTDEYEMIRNVINDFGYIYYEFMLGKYNFDNVLIFVAFFIFWSIYGLLYLLDEEHEEEKNTGYNILDLFSKCFVGIFFWAYFTKIFFLS